MYQKEIIYMGLYKEGSRIGNAGFLKVESRDKESRLDLKLRNIPISIKGRFPIRIHDGNDWKEINGISVQEGSGSWEENMENSVRNVRIQVIFPDGYSLEGRSKDIPELPAQRRDDVKRGPVLVKREEARAETARGGRGSEPVDAAPGVQESVPGNHWEVQTDDKAVDTVQSIPHNKAVDTLKEKEKDIFQNVFPNVRDNVQDITAEHRQDRPRQNNGPVLITEELQPPVQTGIAGFGYASPKLPPAYNLKEDKWEQILDSYEKIHPYGDERVYVKLEPKDFIILQSKYQHLVNNSFLLHGFYNYRYIILGKENDYYLGVPGVFYEREKMVALMFGFEAFECPGGVAKAGEFGYYLRKVEL